MTVVVPIHVGFVHNAHEGILVGSLILFAMKVMGAKGMTQGES
jgi:hypothetical protein